MICENFSLVCHRDKAQKIVSEAAALKEKNRLQGQIELGFHPFFIEHVLRGKSLLESWGTTFLPD